MVPFIGPSYHLATRKADVQRSVNLFPVMNEVIGGKTQSYLQSVPGLDVFSPVYVPPPPVDPDFDSVIFLGVPAPPSDGAITMVDSSLYLQPVIQSNPLTNLAVVSYATRLFNQPTAIVARAPTGGFDVRMENNANLGSGDFSIEWFVKVGPNINPAAFVYQFIWRDPNGSLSVLVGDLAVPQKWSCWLGFDGTSYLGPQIDTLIPIAVGGGLHFVQVIRDNSLLPSNNVLFALDGSVIGTGLFSAGASIDGTFTAGPPYQGIMNFCRNNNLNTGVTVGQMRVTKGVARPIGIPTAPWPLLEVLP